MNYFLHKIEEIGLLFQIRWAEIKSGFILRFFVLPLFLLSFLLFFKLSQFNLDPIGSFYLLTGNIVLALSVGSISLLMQEIANHKKTRTLELFTLLPISVSSYVFALTLAEFCAALPSAMISFVLGMLLFKCPLNISLALILLLPACFLCSYSIAGLGAFIGLKARNPLEANLIGQILLYFLAFIIPVMIPENRLPQALASIIKFSPVHQSAWLIRLICFGTLNLETLILFSVLFIEGTFFLWFCRKSLTFY
ncbi:MAG: ABC transporter permease [candidate division WOR-3 bacterium]